MKNLIILLLSALSFLTGCRSTNIVTLTVTEPAPVSIPASMKRIGTINRTALTEEKQILEKVDQVLSAEGKNLDRDGAIKTMTGLIEELKRNDRFLDVRYLEDENLENSSFGVFPEAVSWEKIAEVCDRNNLEGLISLEYYDTDSRINYSTKQVNLQNPLGIKIPALEHHAAANTIIKTGWRIYDNNNKVIIDKFNITGQVATIGKGINPVSAASAITGRKEAVNQESYKIGQSYAQSIVPYNTKVTRTYYVRGNENFKLAKRKAQTGNWDSAAEIWMNETKSSKSKVAGRALYNMAIINEIDGQIERAITCAQRSYEDFDNKSALRYLNVLKNRKARIRILEHQQQ